MHHLLVSFADFLVLLVVFEIVVAVAEPHAAAAYVHGILCGVVEVFLDADTHEGAPVVFLYFIEEVGHALFAGVLYTAEHRFDGFGAELVAAHGVHCHLVDSGHFVGVGAGSGVCGREAGDDALHAVVARVVEDVELAVAGVFRGQGMAFAPAVGHVVKEVFFRIHRLVDVVEVKAVEVFFGHYGERGCSQREGH